MCIIGYFQSEKYFSHCLKEIRKEFKIKDSFRVQARSNLEGLRQNNDTLVSIHVRRIGQRKGEPWEKVQPNLSIKYYNDAIEIIRQRISKPHFLVFSDEIQWCKKNILYPDVSFSENNSPIVDLAMMSMCDHNIIANSSFSWWAAWLNSNLEKNVIAPKLWVSKEFQIEYNMDLVDLIPSNWHKI